MAPCYDEARFTPVSTRQLSPPACVQRPEIGQQAVALPAEVQQSAPRGVAEQRRSAAAWWHSSSWTCRLRSPRPVPRPLVVEIRSGATTLPADEHHAAAARVVRESVRLPRRRPRRAHVPPIVPVPLPYTRIGTAEHHGDDEHTTRLGGWSVGLDPANQQTSKPHLDTGTLASRAALSLEASCRRRAGLLRRGSSRYSNRSASIGLRRDARSAG